MTILTSIHEIFSDIRYAVHDDYLLMGNRIHFDSDNINWGDSLQKPTKKSCINGDFSVNEDLAKKWGRISEKYKTYEPEKHVAFLICHEIFRNLPITKHNIDSVVQNLNNFTHPKGRKVSLSRLVYNLDPVINDIEPRCLLAAEFLNNQKSYPERWTQEYNDIVNSFIQKSTTISPEDKLVETNFFRQPITLIQLIVLENLPESHYDEGVELMSNAWQPWIDRAKLVSCAQIDIQHTARHAL